MGQPIPAIRGRTPHGIRHGVHACTRLRNGKLSPLKPSADGWGALRGTREPSGGPEGLGTTGSMAQRVSCPVQKAYADFLHLPKGVARNEGPAGPPFRTPCAL